jgi:hypothetical protein
VYNHSFFWRGAEGDGDSRTVTSMVCHRVDGWLALSSGGS